MLLREKDVIVEIEEPALINKYTDTV